MASDTDTVNIVDRGDVILAVGKGSKLLKLRTDSHMLRAASKIFSAMFGPNFAEGHNLNYDTPKEIHFEEDDAEAMKTVCQVIHFKHYLTPQELESNQVLRVAETIDKYSLHETMSLAMAKWLQFKEGTQTLESLGRYMKAAMLLGEAAAFKTVTKAIVLTIVGPYDSLYDATSSNKLVETIYALERRRSELRIHLIQALYDNLTYAAKNNSCVCQVSYTTSLCSNLKKSKLEPVDLVQKPLCESIQAFEVLQQPDPAGDRPCKLWNHSRPSSLWQQLRDATKISAEIFDGLSLEL